MKISTRGRYALRLMIDLAQHIGGDDGVPQRGQGGFHALFFALQTALNLLALLNQPAGVPAPQADQQYGQTAVEGQQQVHDGA